MQCVNCKNHIEPGGVVCPYCHFNPVLLGVGPYDGGGAEPPSCGDFAEYTTGMIGTVLLPVFPVVGGLLLGASVLYGFWKKRR